MQIEIAVDNRVLAFKDYVVCENERMPGELNIFREIQRIRQVRTVERGFFVARLLHFRHGIQGGLQLLRPIVTQQVVGVKRDSLG